MDTIAQRIAIAVSRGWTIGKDSQGEFRIPPGKSIQWFINHGEPWIDITDYLNDHNAMQEVLSTLDQEGQQEFFYQLNDVVGLVDPFSPAWIREFAIFALINATAAQKAEAYLKTIGKWTN